MEPRTAAALVRLGRIPRPLLIVGVLAVVVGGFLAPGVIGAVLLLAVALFASWLTWVTVSTGHARQAVGLVVMRVVILLTLILVALSKLL